MAHQHVHIHTHNHALTSLNTVFIVCIVINLLFVIIEAGVGFLFNSLGLLSDAGHNLSDVFSLLLSLFAYRMAKRHSTDHFTYGYKKSTVLVSLLNAIILLIAVAVFLLVRSQVMFKKRKAKEQTNETLRQLLSSSDNAEVLRLLQVHTREELGKVLAFTEENFERISTSFLHENLRGLRRSMGSVKFEKQLIKQMKRTGTLAMSHLNNNTILEKGLYYYQGNDFASELVYSIGRFCEPCLEHVDNNFKPLDPIQKGEFGDITEDITNLLQVCRNRIENNNYEDMEAEIRKVFFTDCREQVRALQQQVKALYGKKQFADRLTAEVERIVSLSGMLKDRKRRFMLKPFRSSLFEIKEVEGKRYLMRGWQCFGEVEEEMAQLLMQCDGTRSVQELVARNGYDREEASVLWANLQALWNEKLILFAL